MNYDSNAEQLFHQRNPSLIACANDFYPYTFRDNSGTTFRAKPDFWCNEWNCWVEFKGKQLNNQKSKLIAGESYSSAKSYLEYRCRKNGKIPTEQQYSKCRLDHAWNHSLYKQAKVQSSLRAFDKRMIVVFETGTNLTKQSQNLMNAQGMEWLLEDDFAKQLALDTLH